LTSIFPQGMSEPLGLSNPSDQSWIINALAGAFYNLGDFASAMTLLALANQIDLKQRDTIGLSNGLDIYTQSLIGNGELAGAIQATELALSVAYIGEHQEMINQSQKRLVAIYPLMGAFAKAESSYQTLLASPRDYAKNDPFTEIYAARLHFYQGQDPSEDL